MQALLHGGTADRILLNTPIALMGQMDRGDAISGIIEDLGWDILLPHVIRTKPVFQGSGYISSIDQSINQTKPQCPAFQRRVQRPTP